MIRKILLPVRGDGKSEAVFSHAAKLARRYEAHLAVSYCRARPEDMLPFGVPLPGYMRDALKTQAEQLADAEEEKLKSEFLALAAHYDLAVTGKPDIGKACASWTALSGKQVDVIKQFGRLADLICVAKPDRDRNLGANTLKSALFHTGRPVLMCPSATNPPATLGENITIAWNGSTEAARAVALCGNIIASAGTITVLSAGADEIHGSSAADLLDYLAFRGKKASLHRFEIGSKVGFDLLAESAKLGADLMIMGAYGDSHERETLFGGNTQAVVDSAEMPVVLVH